jgi:hypothetical protein
MTTPLEIVYTVVKIGLGAIISGVTTYYVTCRNHNHELIKSAIDDATALLKEAALKLEKSSTSLNVAIEEYDTIASQGNKAGDDFRQILCHILDAYNDGKDAKALFYLIGVPNLGKLVLSYLESLELIRERVRSQIDRAEVDKGALNEPTQKAQEARQSILDALGQAYETIRGREQRSKCG